ncbi:ArsR/SmtB family transcription factor [Priestia taiwanensis]|uniref:Transcriptional regulator n=1 Tax=Priestia taiwanensis TaxID=1347902 RepID=A0A917AQV0_9BACI|nr:ArsR family transcriptional regulator [Priestia taiwanensis]MBM7362572.1 DNA-binding transcriptional ArsR family regulator [Priestia taiwanensis]GGE63328.1 transcriptional regulator [Priestia taiwanensis]
MDYLFSPQQNEHVCVQVESSPVWEIILGITGYTHRNMRHTFDLDEQWTTKQEDIPNSLIERLTHIEKTNFWYGLLMVQNELSATSVQDFSNQLVQIPTNKLYEILLPYHSREKDIARVTIAHTNNQPSLFHDYAKNFHNHLFLEEYIHHLARYSHEELRHLFISVVDEWFNWIRTQEEWEKWTHALSLEEKRQRLVDQMSTVEEVKRITRGIHYQPEPSIWTIKLIPHVSYRPWILEQRTHDTKLFFYPLHEEYLLEHGTPSMQLIRGHKALGDELRLKLLYHLVQGSHSLQELSTHFHISKTTLHHQLSLLKAAKFIHVEKGIYSANPAEITHFSSRLSQYLGEEE